MASLLSRFISKVGNLFRGKPKPPVVSKPKFTVIEGHRGVSLETAQRAHYSPWEISKWKTTKGADGEGFVYGGDPFFVNSSNVLMAQYFPTDQKMMIQFIGGAAYLYSNVTELEAIGFLQSQSKGSWVWDNLRVRGSGTKHRKPYVKVRAGTRAYKMYVVMERGRDVFSSENRSAAERWIVDAYKAKTGHSLGLGQIYATGMYDLKVEVSLQKPQMISNAPPVQEVTESMLLPQSKPIIRKPNEKIFEITEDMLLD